MSESGQPIVDNREQDARGKACGLRRLLRSENLLLAAVILVMLAPVWRFQYYPTTDGPSHLANAQVLGEWRSAEGESFREFYHVRRKPVPNWIGHAILVPLMKVLPPLAAEKVLVSLYLIAFPLAAGYALGAIRPGARSLAFLAAPMALNYLFAMGFYNFCLGLPVFFIAVGFWLKRADRMTWGSAGALMGILVLLYFCHLLPLIVALLAIGVLMGWRTFMDWRAGAERGAIVRRVVLTGLAMLPAALMVAEFIVRTRALGQEPRVPAGTLIKYLGRFESMLAYSPRDLWFSIALAATFGLATVAALIGRLRQRGLQAWDGLGLVLLAVLGMYMLSKDDYRFIQYRMNLFVFMGLLLWLGTSELPRWVLRGMQAAAVIITIGLVSNQWRAFGPLNGLMREYVSAAEHIEPGSTVLPLVYDRFGRAADGSRISQNVEVFYTASAHLVTARNVIDLHNYEANTDHFPISFAPLLNPYNPQWGISIRNENGIGLETVPPQVDVLRYMRHTKRTVDYVLLWGLGTADPADPYVKLTLEQLREAYECIQNTPHMQLWRLRHQP